MKLEELFEGLNLLEDKIKGGIADNSSEDEFDSNELEMGIKIEMEHTDDKDIAREIAMDHLKEIPDYYTRLKKMEDEALNESLFVDDHNEVQYYNQSTKGPQRKHVIDTYLDLEITKLQSNSAQFSGDTVYTAFKYGNTESEQEKKLRKEKEKERKALKIKQTPEEEEEDKKIVNILKAIKGQSSPYTFSEQSRNRLLDKIAEYVNRKLLWTKAYKIDYIMYPQSTSEINKKLAHKLHNISKIPVLDDILLKKKIGNNIEEVVSNVESYLYKDEAIREIGQKKYEELKRSIINKIRENNQLELPIKKVFAKRRKYIKNLLKFEQDVQFLEGKNVLVIDDVLSTGKTMQDALELVRNAGSKKSIGFTIFKY